MDPTTIRLPADTLADLDGEYSDYGYTTRADYIRDIIIHRDPPFEDTATTSDYGRPTTDDYKRLRDRVAELEARLDDLESQSLAQRPNETPDIEAPADPSSTSGPYGQQVDTALAVLRQADEPLRRAQIMSVVDSVEEVNDETLWTEHVRPGIKDSGAELTGRKWTLEE